MGAEDLSSGPRVSMQAVYPRSPLPSLLCHIFSLSSCDGTVRSSVGRQLDGSQSGTQSFKLLCTNVANSERYICFCGRWPRWTVRGFCCLSSGKKKSRKAISELGSFSFVTALSVSSLFLEPCLNVFQVVWPFTF